MGLDLCKNQMKRQEKENGISDCDRKQLAWMRKAGSETKKADFTMSYQHLCSAEIPYIAFPESYLRPSSKVLPTMICLP